jgi:ribosomal protein L24E
VPRHRRSLLRLLAAVVGTALLAGLPVVTPRPLAADALTPRPPGYWLIGGDGSVYRYGSAGDLGSLRGTTLARPVTGMAPTPSGNGYWLVASDGGIFSFGDAAFHGSTGNLKLNKPIVGMAPTPTGKGYWFVASDGGIFSFGDAAFYGSTGAMKLAKPITGMAASPTGKGYWFVASDGGIFNFGDAGFLGSAGSTALPAGIVVMSAGLLPAPGTVPTQPTTPTTGPGTSTTVTSGPPPTGEPFEIALIGDSGYSAAQYDIFDRVVEHMNSFDLSFVVHDGDFKDPLPACSDSRFSQVRESFNKSKAPFVYTPGDNEWMDCDDAPKPENRMDSVERLGKLREMFFATDESLGVNRMPLTTQRQRGYPENARWSKEGVVFATINAPGSTDNTGCPNPSEPCDPSLIGVESNPRRDANAAWLREAFDVAQSTNAPAVMIIWQADPWFPGAGAVWKYLMDELRARTIAFGKPVVLVHGDTHAFRIDKGGRPNKTTGAMEGGWDDVPNFTRVETWAAGAFSASQPELHPDMWIRATVDPKSPQVFTFTSEQAP